MVSEFGGTLWFGGQGAIAGTLGVLYVKRSGSLLQRTYLCFVVALLVAMTATICTLVIGIVLDLAWLRPHVHVAALVAWLGTGAIVAPEPEKPRIEGPIGPASRAFHAYKRRPPVFAPPDRDRW